MPEERPRKSSRWFTCLVKGPLGCLAFSFGALVVVVLFLPSAVGRMSDRLLEQSFAERFEGSLELSEVWLGSFYNQQRIDSLSVRDPNQEEILRGSLRASSLGMLMANAEEAAVDLHLANLHLVEYPDGSTNLERAFRRREGAKGLGDVSISLLQSCNFSLRIDRLRWIDARGRSELLADLVWNGTIELRPTRTRVTLAGGSDASLADALQVQLSYESRSLFSEGPWEGKLSLACQELPLGLARHAAGSVLPLALFDDDVLEELVWTREGERATLAVRDEGVELVCAGMLESGFLRTDPEQPARLILPLGTAAGEALLARCAPFLVPEVLAGAGPVEFRLEEALLPRDGAWSGLAGTLRFRLPSGTFGLAPGAATELGANGGLAPFDLGASLKVDAGTLELGGLALALEGGSMLEYAGRAELATGRIDVSITRAQDGVRTPLGRWVGRDGALARAAPAPPAPPEAERR
jgi:hypothetical protein